MISKGQRYRVRTDVPVIAMTAWAAPFTGGYDRVLHAGEEFIIASDPPGDASAVYADPADYSRLQREFIPLSDRWRLWVYRGFYLCIQIKDIESRCELIKAAGYAA